MAVCYPNLPGDGKGPHEWTPASSLVSSKPLSKLRLDHSIPLVKNLQRLPTALSLRSKFLNMIYKAQGDLASVTSANSLLCFRVLHRPPPHVHIHLQAPQKLLPLPEHPPFHPAPPHKHTHTVTTTHLLGLRLNECLATQEARPPGCCQARWVGTESGVL